MNSPFNIVLRKIFCKPILPKEIFWFLKFNSWFSHFVDFVKYWREELLTRHICKYEWIFKLALLGLLFQNKILMQRNEETLMRTYGGIEVTKKCKDCQIKRLDSVDKSNLVETNCRVFFFFRKQQIISSVEFAQTNNTSISLSSS